MNTQRRTVRWLSSPILSALLVAACGGSPAASGAATAGSSAGAGPSETATLPPDGGQQTPGALPTLEPEPTEMSQGEAGAFHVVLTGSRPGAGTYDGTANVTCISSPGSHGNTVWNLATLVDPSTGVTHITIGVEDSGEVSVLVEATEQIEFSPWSADSSGANGSANVDVKMSGSVATFHATGSPASGGESIDLTISCVPLT